MLVTADSLDYRFLGKFEFLVRHTPGHSPGSVSFIGEGCVFINPRAVEIVGPHIRIGRNCHINAEPTRGMDLRYVRAGWEVDPNVRAITSCLWRNRASLSPACAAAFDQAAQ